MLLFKKKFLDAIRQGQKTQTVRLWKWREMKPGQRSYIPGAGYIQIGDVDEVALEKLTDDDARLDGFESAAALRHEITQLYPKQLVAGYRAFRIRFTLLPPDVEREMRSAKNQSKTAGAQRRRAAIPLPLSNKQHYATAIATKCCAPKGAAYVSPGQAQRRPGFRGD